MKLRTILSLGIVLFFANLHAQDPNFHIYVCFGQSNMEGMGNIEEQDRSLDERFKVFQALDCSNLGRTRANWYTAEPPLCQCYSKLTPADYFGRTMLANMPDSITIGVINVAVGGCDIRLFDKDIYQDYDSTYAESWFTDKIAFYEGNPYQYLIDLALQAQQDGVIKGILLHQGETNNGDSQWPSYVKKIYNDMLTDLSLSANNVPLLAGEVAYNACCSGMNTIIANLPDTITTAHVISSLGCTVQDDAHFTSDGYRELGRRYAIQMLSILEQEVQYGRGTQSIYYEAECATVGDNWTFVNDDRASNSNYLIANSGTDNTSSAPTETANTLVITFNIDSAGNYDIYGRIKGPSTSEDSFWVTIDSSPSEAVDGLRSSSWKWSKFISVELSAGEHMLTIATREDGAMIDKVNISDHLYAPSIKGLDAENICEIDYTNIKTDIKKKCKLNQSFPNPSKGIANISFDIPDETFVAIKLTNMQGIEITQITNKVFEAGNHTVKINTETYPAGNYLYTMQTQYCTATKELTISTE